MNFPFRSFRGLVIPLIPLPRKNSGRLKGAWSRDPRTGRLVQNWSEEDDGERSCTGRPSGPPNPRLPDGLKRAA